MGNPKKAGHLPNIYSLNFIDKLVNEYDRYLAPDLSLNKASQSGDNQKHALSEHTNNDTLIETIRILTEQVKSLRKQLEETQKTAK